MTDADCIELAEQIITLLFGHSDDDRTDIAKLVAAFIKTKIELKRGERDR